MVVIAVAQEDKDLESHAKMVRRFEPSPRFEIVADLAREETGKYDRTSTYLIDKKGVIRWSDHPAYLKDSMIEGLIAE